jgi:hypothetical protein
MQVPRDCCCILLLPAWLLLLLLLLVRQWLPQIAVEIGLAQQLLLELLLHPAAEHVSVAAASCCVC